MLWPIKGGLSVTAARFPIWGGLLGAITPTACCGPYRAVFLLLYPVSPFWGGLLGAITPTVYCGPRRAVFLLLYPVSPHGVVFFGCYNTRCSLRPTQGAIAVISMCRLSTQSAMQIYRPLLFLQRHVFTQCKCTVHRLAAAPTVSIHIALCAIIIRCHKGE